MTHEEQRVWMIKQLLDEDSYYTSKQLGSKAPHNNIENQTVITSVGTILILKLQK